MVLVSAFIDSAAKEISNPQVIDFVNNQNSFSVIQILGYVIFPLQISTTTPGLIIHNFLYYQLQIKVIGTNNCPNKTRKYYGL